jgi:acylpyruvate hydrolase
MRLATIRQADGTRSAARVEGTEVVALPFTDLGQLLASGDSWRVAAGENGPTAACADVTFDRLIPQPSKVICVGRNFLDHIREGGSSRPGPDFPELFTKFPESLVGPYDDIEIGGGSDELDFQKANAGAAKQPMTAQPFDADFVDWEAELVVVVGRTVRRADAQQATDAIAGFTVGNDVSVRDWQLRTSQWMQGKAWEAMSPVGPVLVTTDDVGARPDLRIECLLDGETMQDYRTGGIVFDPVDIVSYVSRFVTLRPGDLLFTGTDAGVGISRNPPVYVRPGQVLTTRAEGIGEIANRFVARVEGATDSPGPAAESDRQPLRAGS